MDQAPSAINVRKKKGVLGLSYSREFGNYLLAFGFSNFVYMYSLDISVTKGYTGRYKEHSGTILWAKFLKSSPYVVSFDERLNLRIWDYRRFVTIQFINCERVCIYPNRLEIIPEYC
jgi:WD40 repeat protein